MARIPPSGRRVALRRRRHLQRWPPRRHPGHERRLPAADRDAGTGRTDMDLTGITTMATIGIIFGTEGGRSRLVAKALGFPIFHFSIAAITSINPRSIGEQCSIRIGVRWAIP